jgi:hypothetical protein
MLKKLFLLAPLVFLIYCGSVATVRPLDVNQRAFSLSLGGPVAEVPFIATLPIPYSVLRYRWGILDRLEGHIGLHLTTMLYGAAGVDAGLSYGILEQKGAIPYLCAGINPTMWINPFYEAAGFRPEAELTASWNLSDMVLIYTGAQAFFQLEEPYVPFAPMLGTEVVIGNTVGLTLEAKWYAPLENSRYRVVTYPLSPGEQGALGMVLGITLYPGGISYGHKASDGGGK